MVPSITLTNPGTQTSYDGDAINLSLTSRNSASHAMSYFETNLPPGLSVGAGSYSAGTGHAIISGTISSNADQGGPYSVTITATDTTTLTQGGQSFTWKIIQPTLTLTQPEDQINCDGDTVSLKLAASENASHTLTYSESGLPTGLSINPSTGVISGSIGSNDSLQGYSATVTTTDPAASLVASKTFNWTLVPIKAVLSNPDDQFNTDGDTVNLTVVAETSYATAGVFNFGLTGQPPGLSISSGTAVISGTVASDADQSTPYAAVASVTDISAGLSASDAFNWTVFPTGLALANPGDQSSNDGSQIGLALSATENNVDGLHFTATALPAGLTIGDCWFVAPEDALANYWGTSIQAGAGYAETPIITYTGEDAHGFQWYQVTFAGRAPVNVPFLPGERFANPVNAARPMRLSTNDGNGDWAAILELGWALLNDPGVSSATAISDVLNGGAANSGGSGAAATRALTGHTTTTLPTATTPSSAIATALAYAEVGQVVTASEWTPPDLTPLTPYNPHGLVVGTASGVGHCYAVLGYNAATQMVHLQNPWGSHQPYTEWVYQSYNTILKPAGWYEVERPALGGGAASFWLPLADFCSWFRSVSYEN